MFFHCSLPLNLGMLYFDFTQSHIFFIPKGLRALASHIFINFAIFRLMNSFWSISCLKIEDPCSKNAWENWKPTIKSEVFSVFNDDLLALINLQTMIRSTKIKCPFLWDNWSQTLHLMTFFRLRCLKTWDSFQELSFYCICSNSTMILFLSFQYLKDSLFHAIFSSVSRLGEV